MDRTHNTAEVKQAPLGSPPPREGAPKPLGKKPSSGVETPVTFPKEFNRNFLKSLDRRFVFILLMVLIIEPALIINLLLNYQPLVEGDDVAKLQAKYADLFLSEFEVETPEETLAQNELLLQASELAKKMAGEAYGTAGSPALPDLRPGAGTAETRAASREESQARRGVAAVARGRAREALTQEVGRVGLLGIITAGSNLIAQGSAEQVLDYAAMKGRDLDAALAEVKGVRVPRLGTDYFGTAIGSGLGGSGDIIMMEREVRGSRFTDSGVKSDDVVTSLAAAPNKRVEANRTFEVVKREPSLTGLRGRHGQNGDDMIASRDPERIRAIVTRHNAAIQDCYRKQLKHNPTLKCKVSVRITIDYTGHVIGVNIVSSTVDLPELSQCLISKITRWKDFGEMAPSTKPVTFKQTYVFGY